MKKKSAKERELESQVKKLKKIIESRGFSVRRENLSRGPAFRVKSGGCHFSGSNVIFVDRRLPLDQQTTLLTDYILELGLEVSDEETEGLSDSLLELLKGSARAA